MAFRFLLQRLFPTGRGNEEVKEANEVKINVAENSVGIPSRTNVTNTMGSPSYAEPSTSRGSLIKGKGKIEENASYTKKKSKFSKQEMDLFKEKGFRVGKSEPKCLIHKVHGGLRHFYSARHYEPALLSIGPYHRVNTAVQDMEKHKVHYSQLVLDGEKEQNCVRAIEAWKKEGVSEALDCYVDTFKMDLVSFGDCMVLDSLFMIGLFLRNGDELGDTSKDMLFNIRWMKPHLARDMLLFENQIPFFVLRELFRFTEQGTKPDEEKFVRLALEYFEFNGEQIIRNRHDDYLRKLSEQLNNIPHLLGLVYHALVPETPKHQNYKESQSCELIRTAVALEEVGVSFLKADETYGAFYNIKFDKGELRIPQLVINDSTESFFRNLVAYEQYSQHHSLHRITDYLRVMDCLINSSKDVKLLRHCGIIDNRIGDDVKVSIMFNKLCSGVYFDQKQFYYAQMFNEVNKFCKNPWNMRWAKLKNDYFGSPWSGLSVAAAVTLLFLTTMQTVYSVLSYYQP